MSTDTPRRTGFTRPFANVQIGSWVVYTAELALYFAIIFPTLRLGEQIGISIPWLVLFITFNGFFIRAELESHSAPSITRPAEYPGCYVCDTCQQFVVAGSHHCRFCGLCRMDFDHHCFFLNNCVTKANYRDFLLGVVFLTIFSLYFTFIAIWVVMANVYEDGRLFTRLTEFYKTAVRLEVFYGGCGAILLIQLGVLIFTGYLIGLHWALKIRQITTYKLIVYRRDAKLVAGVQAFPPQELEHLT
jgi:hypothetical protein